MKKYNLELALSGGGARRFAHIGVIKLLEECDAVIGSNVSPVIPDKYKKTIVGIAERSYHYLFKANTDKDREICDILIETEEFSDYKVFDIDKVEIIAEIGYNAAERAFDNFLNNKPIAMLIKKYSAKKVMSNEKQLTMHNYEN
jgi:Predicted esterase of the alpha-beta hydrolase superfamily